MSEEKGAEVKQVSEEKKEEENPNQYKIDQLNEELKLKIKESNERIEREEINGLLDMIWDTYDQNGEDLIGPSELKDFLKDLLTNVLDHRKEQRKRQDEAEDFDHNLTSDSEDEEYERQIKSDFKTDFERIYSLFDPEFKPKQTPDQLSKPYPKYEG